MSAQDGSGPAGASGPSGTPRSVGPAGGLLASAALIAAVTAVARVVGFGRWLVFSTQVGTTCVGDVYTRANTLPNVLYEVVAGGALAGAVIPLLAGPLSRGDREQVDRIVSALISWVLVVLVPLSVVFALAAGPLAGLLVEDNADCTGKQELAARMIAVFAPQIALYGIGVVLTGVLNAHRRFFWPAAAPLLSSLVVIGAYLAYGRIAPEDGSPAALSAAAQDWLTWGTTAGVAVMTVPLLLPARRAGVRLRLTLTFPPGVARRGLVLAGAGISALLAQQLSLLVVLALAGRTNGAYPVYQYAQAVYLLPYAVLAVPLATSAFPRLAERAEQRDRDGFAGIAAGSTRVVVLVSMLGAAVLAGAAVPVGDFFAAIDRSDDSAGPLVHLGSALTVMAPGLVGFALIAHIGRALYALDRGRSAAVATAAGWLTVIAGSVAGVLLGPVVTGLAWGNTIGMSVAGALLVAALRRAAGPASVAGLGRSTGAGALAALVAGSVGRLAAAAVPTGAGPQVAREVVRALGAGVLGAAVAAVVFAGLLALLDRRNLGMLIARITRRSSP